MRRTIKNKAMNESDQFSAEQLEECPASSMNNPPETTATAGQATISFDWLSELKDGRLIFQVRITRGEKESSFDIGIELDQLQKSELEYLQNILSRRQDLLSDSRELYASTAWLLETALSQEGLGKEERQTKIDTLLLRDALPLKEQLIRKKNELFLVQVDGQNFVEGAEDLDCYDEVYRCWRNAVRRLNVGTPRLPTADVREEAELELFLLRLRHESVPDACDKHKVLYAKWDANQDFCDAVAAAIQKRLHQNQTGMQLDYYLLCCWLDRHFWLLSNNDRADLLKIYTGIQVSADAIRKAVDKLELKDWSIFQPKGTRAPCFLDCSVDLRTKQKMCRILPRNPGKR
jgi:hypothetical protein